MLHLTVYFNLYRQYTVPMPFQEREDIGLAYTWPILKPDPMVRVCCVVLLLFHVLGKHLRSCRDGKLT